MPSEQSEATSAFLEPMQHLLVGSDSAAEAIVLPERLDRSRLDFSLDSLQVIDQYLNDVHDNDQTVVGLSLLTTIWATALYVGEIIRRGAPAQYFEWVMLADQQPASGGTTTSQVDLGAVRALRAHDGELCLPSRAVLRVILRGRKARSVHSFARGAIEASTWAPNPLDPAEQANGASAP